MGISVRPSPFGMLSHVVTERRTRKDFTGEPVDRATIEELLDLARWAPNHRLHEPWRFVVIEQPAIARLIDFLRGEPAIAAYPDPAKAQAKLAKLIERLPRCGALIQATWVRDADPAIDLEDHAATAAAVQNVLLGATALDLGSFWSTTPALGHPATLRWCGIDPAREGHLGTIWLGHVQGEPPAAPPRKPLGERVRWIGK